MIHSERLTADLEGDFAVFLIGMRINKPWKIGKWWPVAQAMPRMLRELAARHVNELHVEAGAKLNGALLDADLVDELLLFVAPAVIGDPARGMFERATPLASLSQRDEFAFRDIARVGADLRIVARRVGAETF